jgi:GTP-binding protein
VKIKAVDFAGAVAKPDGPRPGTLPQIAFSGRSNVGKSSLINTVLGRTRSKIARVSATPGKTQEINFYQVLAEVAGRDREFYLVDLPGYGYARVPLSVKEKWRPLIESYLSRTPELIGVVQLVDSRREPTPEDRRMIAFLAGLGVPSLVVLTKSDKLSKGAAAKQLKLTVDALGVSADQVVLFSSLNGSGRDELLESIAALLEMDGSE